MHSKIEVYRASIPIGNQGTIIVRIALHAQYER